MKKKIIATLFVLIILLQSCTFYQKTASPLNLATNKGKVKVIRSYNNTQGNYTVHKYTNISYEEGTFYGVNGNKKTPIIPSESTSVYLKDIKKSRKVTILGVTIPVGVVVVGVIFLVIACNCPYVDIIDEDGEASFQGTLFPGAIFESLERTDQLVMDYQPKKDNVQVRISNVLPEKEYINEVKLLQYQVKDDERLAINNSGKLIAVSNLLSTEKALDINGTNWINEVSIDDGIGYQFDDNPKIDQFNRLDLKFHIDDQMDDINLVIRGKQTEWVEVVGDQLFSLFGNKFNNWVEKMDNVDPVTYNLNAAESGLSLRVLAKIEGEYTLIDAFHNAGTKMERDMVLNLPPNLNYGPELEIRLESSYRFWEIDQVALAKNIRTELDIKEMELLSAISNNDKDVKLAISTIDENYGNNLSTGDFIDLNFNYDQPENGMISKLVLRGTGYYHHEKEYTHPINKKALRALQKPYATHQYSQLIEQAHLLAKGKQAN